jgi:hypothetical protein
MIKNALQARLASSKILCSPGLRELQSATGEKFCARFWGGRCYRPCCDHREGRLRESCEMAKKKKQVADHSLMQEFEKQVKTKHKEMKFLLNTNGEINMSDAIMRLIEPFKDDAADYEDFRGLVTLACIAWNTSLFSEEKREKILGEMMDVYKGSIEDQVDTFNLISELMERKRKLFPNISRMIVEHKVTDRGGDLHIAVASTLEKNNDKS